ncbi:ABC transporter permease [Salinigranum salinum]|uniref:ABC transporter permease n=1 Tax=Salinigranum salinum TaxID=1364937 RepID=UPI001260BA65|nr:ABC transporter permease [Salinigranum salinum]
MELAFNMTPRQRTPAWLSVSAQLFTVVAALVLAAVPLLVVGVNPLAAYGMMFLGAVTDPFQATRVLNRSAPLILAGLAVYLPLRSGKYNIGAEGQLVVGGIVAVWAGLNLPSMLGIGATGLPMLLLLFLASALFGALWVFVPVYLLVKYDVNEILTTLMLVFVAQRLNDFLINGPMQAPLGAFPRTPSIEASLPTLFGTDVDVGIVVALLAVAAVWVLMNETRLGYEIRLTGSNPRAATQTGIDAAVVTFVVFTLAAAFAGLAGFIEIVGNQQQLTPAWNPGYGWTAIPIALLGRRGAIQTMLAGFLFGVLFVGGLAMETTLGVPAAISSIIEALIILFLIASEFVRTYRFDVRIGGFSSRRSFQRLTGVDGEEGI